MKKLVLLILLSTLSACVYNPRMNIATMPQVPLEGPPDYIEGWRAGCETGMATYGNSYYRTKYRTNVEGHRMENPQYNKGWELGQRYCSYYSSTYLQNKEMDRAFSNEYTTSDLRSDNTWVKLKSDGWFSYAGWEKFEW